MECSTYRNIIHGINSIISIRLFCSIAIDLTFDKLLPIIELSVVASAIAYLLFVYSVLKIGITQSNMFANLIPVFTAIFAWFMLDETLTFRATIGILLVIIGLSIPHWQRVKKRYFFLKK